MMVCGDWRVMRMMKVHYSWRGDGEGREMEERAVAAEVRRGQLGVTRDRAVRVQQPANTTDLKWSDSSHSIYNM